MAVAFDGEWRSRSLECVHWHDECGVVHFLQQRGLGFYLWQFIGEKRQACSLLIKILFAIRRSGHFTACFSHIRQYSHAPSWSEIADAAGQTQTDIARQHLGNKHAIVFPTNNRLPIIDQHMASGFRLVCVCDIGLDLLPFATGECRPVFQQYFSAQQIEGLNTIGTFVNQFSDYHDRTARPDILGYSHSRLAPGSQDHWPCNTIRRSRL